MFSKQITLRIFLFFALGTGLAHSQELPQIPKSPRLAYVGPLMSFGKGIELPPGPALPWDLILRRYLPLLDDFFIQDFLVNGSTDGDLPSANQESRLVRVDESPLPDCLKPEVRLKETFFDSPGSETLDVIYFNPDDPSQRTKANKSTGNVVPYQASLFLDKDAPEVDDWQLFARRAGIRCLPTHFRFRYIGSKRYMEHREGDRAFDEKK